MKQLLIVLLLNSAFIHGQDNQTPLSLNDAIQRALVNRYDLKIQKTNTKITEKQLSEVASRDLPQISSDLDVRYNSQLQTNILPGSFFGPNGSDRPVQFGTKYNTLWGFNLNQQIYNPANLSDKKIATIQTEYQKQNEKLTEINIKQDVTEAYFAALLWKEKMDLSAENVKRAQEVYQVMQNQLSNAQATQYDVQRNLIDFENARATNEQNQNNYKLSVSDLFIKYLTTLLVALY